MNKKIENDVETPKIENSIETPKEEPKEYSVIKDFVNKDDMKEYRVGTKTFLVTERAKTLSDLGYINAIPTTTI